MNLSLQKILFLLIILATAKSFSSQKNMTPFLTQPDSDIFFNPRVVYGTDDRKEPYQAKSKSWQDHAHSTVALMSKSNLNDMGTFYKLPSEAFGDSYGMCKTEPFYNQINPAFCSGSLIAEDLILTAGHCMGTDYDCKNTSFVFDFGYYNMADDVGTVDKSKVYNCASIVHSQVEANGSDFSIIKLDRPVMDRSPLTLRKSGTIADNESIVVIGHPVGLPVKISDNAKVRNNINKPFFVANLDTYGGNSGSAVLNESTGQVEGVLVRGEQDFTTSSKGCRISNVCKDNECRGEDVTRISEVIPFLPQ